MSAFQVVFRQFSNINYQLSIALFFFCLFSILNAQGSNYALYYTVSDSTRIGITGAPYPSYTSEKGAKIGLTVILFEKSTFKNQFPGQNFNLRVDSDFGENNDREFAVRSSIPLRRVQQRFEFYTQYKHAQTDFWGIGANTPDAVVASFIREHYVFNGSWQKLFTRHFSAGIGFDIGGYRNHNFCPEAEMTSSPLGSDHFYRAVGLGSVFIYNTTMPNNFPTSGVFYKNQITFFEKALKSDYSFLTLRQEVRYFYPIGEHIIANQVVGNNTFGDRPYHYYSEQGGSTLGRGYKTARFLDYHFIGGQTEYRSPMLFWRVSAVSFVSAGLSYKGINDFISENVHFAGGGGFRFALDRDERVNVRGDIAFSAEGMEIYLKFGESF